MERLLKLVSEGATLKMAAELADIGEATLYRWRKECESFESHLVRALAEASARRLANVERAGSGSEKVTTRVVRRQEVRERHTKMPDSTVVSEPVVLELTTEERTVTESADWKAAAWLLERTRPEEFRDRRSTESEAPPLVPPDADAAIRRLNQIFEAASRRD